MDGFEVGGLITAMQRTVITVGTQADDTDVINEYQIAYNLSVSYTHLDVYKRQIDWSGEEYSGQVKRSITMMLKNYGIERFLWDTKKRSIP